MIKKAFHKMRENAYKLNKRNILELLEINPSAKILDLGCDEGTWSNEIAKTVNSNQIYGLEINEEQLNRAREKGLKTEQGDLNNELPYENNYFDCVHSNQVIEHLVDVDKFLAEIHRVLKKDAYCIISTENLSSWVNIGALIFGWQPFSLTNISNKSLGIGNPLAIHRNESIRDEGWLHIKVMTTSAIKDLFKLHGFKVEKVLGAGYFPLPAILGKIDPRHGHFITFKATKL